MPDEPEMPPTPETPVRRRRAWIAVLLVLLAVALLDVVFVTNLFRGGSTSDLDHASERINDLSTGPNAP